MTEAQAPLPLVMLTTDFGQRDPYVGAMKGVLHSLCPGVEVEDLSHEIAAQNVLEGALFLVGAMPYSPPGAIHCVVVDPGVGSERRGIAVRADGRYFVGPDNGLLTLYLLEHPLEEARVITNRTLMRETIDPTFHGRDVFAPVAAYLAAGGSMEAVGDEAGELVLLDIPCAALGDDGLLHGTVIHIDHFGNCITNIRRNSLRAGARYQLQAAGTAIKRISPTYASVEPGMPLALFGSTGCLEIAVRNGDASEALRIRVGTPVALYTG